MNYFAYRHLNEDDKKIAARALQTNDYETLTGLMPENFHVGRDDEQNQFTFDHNYWRLFDNNATSLKAYLNGCQILDNDGREIAKNDFWAMVENKKHLPAAYYTGDLDGYRVHKTSGFR